jgi:MFS transporter, FHS family, L-fucose permease
MIMITDNGRRRPQYLGLALLIHFTFALVLMIPQVLLPFWQESFQLSKTAASVLGALFFLAYGLTAIPQSLLLDRVGLKRFTLAASLLIALSSIVFVARPSFALGLVTFFMMGIGVTALQIAGSLVVKQLDSDPQKYSRNYSLILVVIGVGGLSGGLLIGVIVNRLQLPWTMLYYLFAGLAFCLALLTARTHFPARPATAVTSLRAYRVMAANRNLVRYAAGIFVYLGVEIGIATWIVTFLTTQFQIGKVEAAAVVSLYWLMQTIGRLLGGILLHYVSPGKALALFAVGCGGSLLLALGGGSVIRASAGFALAGFFTPIMYPVLFAAGLRQVERAYENVAAGILSSAVVGGAVVPPLIALLSQATGSLRLSLALVVILSLMYISYLGLQMRSQRTGRRWTGQPAGQRIG